MAAEGQAIGKCIFPNPVEPAVDRFIYPGFTADLGSIQEKFRPEAVVGAVGQVNTKAAAKLQPGNDLQFSVYITDDLIELVFAIGYLQPRQRIDHFLSSIPGNSINIAITISHCIGIIGSQPAWIGFEHWRDWVDVQGTHQRAAKLVVAIN